MLCRKNGICSLGEIQEGQFLWIFFPDSWGVSGEGLLSGHFDLGGQVTEPVSHFNTDVGFGCRGSVEEMYCEGPSCCLRDVIGRSLMDLKVGCRITAECRNDWWITAMPFRAVASLSQSLVVQSCRIRSSRMCMWLQERTRFLYLKWFKVSAASRAVLCLCVQPQFVGCHACLLLCVSSQQAETVCIHFSLVSRFLKFIHKLKKIKAGMCQRVMS